MINPADIPVVILCGGMGTRLKEETGIIPKPMVTIGGRPLLWHLMKFYSASGFRRFILCLGYKGEVIKHYFLNYFQLTSSFTIEVGNGGRTHIVDGSASEPWSVSCVDTGEQAMTGARVKRIQSYVGSSPFLLTYGDGLADIDLDKLLDFHRGHGKLVTITGVHPPSRFGLLTLDGHRVAHFAEKPHTAHDYINGGFFVCEPGFFDFLDADDKCTLERQPLERAAERGELHAFLHDGYWQCMDTLRDRELLEEAWQQGGPWENVVSAYSWQDKPVFVTGATGLLGSWLVRELQSRGALVVALVRDCVPQSHLWTVTQDRLIVVSGRLEDYEVVARTLNEYEIDTVFHLGAQTVVSIANRNPLPTFEANIRGTYHVLEACRLASTVKAVVVASSDKAYGDHTTLPYDESTPLVGRHPYDVSKTCADLLALAYHTTFNLPVCVTRCGNLYGPGDLNFNRIVPGTIRSIVRGEAPIIRSDGTFIRDYFYVHDGALAYVHLAEMMHTHGIAGHAFNFSNEIQVTVRQLVDRILRLMDAPFDPIVQNIVTGEIVHQYLSAAKARTMLEWHPRYDLDRALVETIAWYREFLRTRTTPPVDEVSARQAAR